MFDTAKNPLNVADLWAEFANQMIPKDVSDSQRFGLQVTFYMGFGTALETVKLLRELTTREHFIATYERLEKEIDSFRFSKASGR